MCLWSSSSARRPLPRTLILENGHDWEQLAVVWHKGLSNAVRRANKLLEHQQRPSHDEGVPRVQCGCERKCTAPQRCQGALIAPTIQVNTHFGEV